MAVIEEVDEFTKRFEREFSLASFVLGMIGVDLRYRLMRDG